MDNNQLWQAVLGELELTISKANFTTWFKGTHILSFDESKITIGVPNTFTKAWLEKKFRKNINEIISKVASGQNIREIEFSVSQKKAFQEKSQQKAPTQYINQSKPQAGIQNPSLAPVQQPNSFRTLQPFSLNQKYTFSSFVVGKCNELAHAAAQAVAQKPGQAYNPLFIYGGVGLGKTHLLQAIGNEITAKNPHTQILYVSSEKFTSDFIKSIATKKMDQFKRTYRTVDILLMDDVQFLAGKEGTQEEFFHTFNELHQNNRQLIVTSDRPPKAIPALEKRLLSRFEWGMIADVSPIDYETRIAILRSKCEQKGLTFDEETIEYIGRTIHNNVREIEGALNRINAHLQLHNLDSSLSIIKNILASISTLPRTSSLSVTSILDTVCEFYDVSLEELVGKSREKRLVYPRQIAMFLLREELRSSYPAIGKELGGRDHTTAMHACQKITKSLENDDKVRQDFNLIKQKLFT